MKSFVSDLGGGLNIRITEKAGKIFQYGLENMLIEILQDANTITQFHNVTKIKPELVQWLYENNFQ